MSLTRPRKGKFLLFNLSPTEEPLLDPKLIQPGLEKLNFKAVNIKFFQCDEDFKGLTFEQILSEESEQDFSTYGCLVVCIFAKLEGDNGNFQVTEPSGNKHSYSIQRLCDHFKSAWHTKPTLFRIPKFFFLNDCSKTATETRKFLHMQQNIDAFISVNRAHNTLEFLTKLSDDILEIPNSFTLNQKITHHRPRWHKAGELDRKEEKCNEFTQFLLDLSSNDCFKAEKQIINLMEPNFTHDSVMYGNKEKGLVFVLNCQTFNYSSAVMPQSTKEFTEKLVSIFEYFRSFEVKCLNNFNAEYLQNSIRKAVNQRKRKYSCLILCLLTYGNETNIYLRDEKPLTLPEFIEHFLNDHKLKPLDKIQRLPRFMFIQNCQKTKLFNESAYTLFPAISSDQFDRSILNLTKLSLPEDFLLLHSIHQQYESKQSLGLYGEWTIPLFCKALKDYAHRYDLLTICKMIFLSQSNNYRSFTAEHCMPRNTLLKSTLSKMFFLPQHCSTPSFPLNEISRPFGGVQKQNIELLPQLLCKRDALFYNLSRTELMGKCILLNYISLEHNPKIEKAIQSLKQTFELLKFVVSIKSEMSNEDARIFLQKESRDSKNFEFDCLLVFVLTSGDTSKVFDQEEMIELFTESKGLIGKPKLFIVQAYTDYSQVPTSQAIQHDATINMMQLTEPNICVIPKYADILLFQSPFETLTFLNVFCDILKQYASQHDLFQLLTLICDQLLSEESVCLYKQIPRFNSTLTRLVRFDTSKLDSCLTQNESSQIKNVYPNCHGTVGRCLVLNYEVFAHLPDRTRVGSDKDVRAIRETFETFGFKVIERSNATASETMDFLKTQAAQIDPDCDCFVLFVLTHGESDRYIWCKDTLLHLDEMLDCFSDLNCPKLEGKPRIVFVEACQGTKFDDGVSVEEIISNQNTDTLSSVNQSSPLFRLFDHFVVFCSSYPGYVSWRNRENGTWFVQSLCRVLDQYAMDYDLLSMFVMVCQEVALNYQTENLENTFFDGKKQIPVIYSTLKALVSLNVEAVFPSYFY